MSYDIDLCDPVSGDVLLLDEPHQMKGGTYCLGGTRECHINVTYNYCRHFERVIPPRSSVQYGDTVGIRAIYGMTGADSIPVLEEAASKLGDDVDDDYWAPTEGNAKRALLQLIALAKLLPDGVWKGD